MNDSVFIGHLRKRLEEAERAAIEHIVQGLPLDKYHQTCGQVQAFRQVREVMVDEIIKDFIKHLEAA
ncbi:MAG: hypothetical protein KGL39_06465 [Patescibacteria group bacterium]|nr:hypothetical protein [Patescibacteria group bacterium]